MKTPNKIVPCIWLDDQAEAAAAFYARTFPNGRVMTKAYYPTSNVSAKRAGTVVTVDFEVLGQRFVALNGGPEFKPNQTLSFFVHAKDEAEVDRLFGALQEGGKVLMALDAYEWSKRYGWVQDRYGVTWQIMLSDVSGDAARIAPCFMFVGKQLGRAEEAIRFWTSTFEGGKVDHIAHYPKSRGPEKNVMHGRFYLLGQRFVAMDSHVDQTGVSFNEGLSLTVMCRDQAEIDKYWQKLTAGGEEGPCGWAKDRFGFSWQIAPDNISQLLTTGDAAARDRFFAVMMKMKKLDKAALEDAFRGKQPGAGRSGGGTQANAPPHR
jgi:predicted 3-demethylubiquinone-9 3-methyltransferase (glyoxalase superfamily)